TYSPVPGDRDEDYEDDINEREKKRKQFIDEALKLLSQEFGTYKRMFKSIPVPARAAACKIAAVYLKAFSRAYKDGKKEEAIEALRQFLLIPRRYFTRERGGHSRAVHKRSVKELKS